MLSSPASCITDPWLHWSSGPRIGGHAVQKRGTEAGSSRTNSVSFARRPAPLGQAAPLPIHALICPQLISTAPSCREPLLLTLYTLSPRLYVIDTAPTAV